MDKKKVYENPFCERRKNDINRSYDIIKAACKGNKRIEYEKAKALIELNVGVTNKTAGSYLRVLRVTDAIRKEGEYLYIGP